MLQITITPTNQESIRVIVMALTHYTTHLRQLMREELTVSRHQQIHDDINRVTQLCRDFQYIQCPFDVD